MVEYNNNKRDVKWDDISTIILLFNSHNLAY